MINFDLVRISNFQIIGLYDKITRYEKVMHIILINAEEHDFMNLD